MSCEDGGVEMSEMEDALAKVSSDDLAKLIKEEIQKFLVENRDLIIKRAEERLKELRKK